MITWQEQKASYNITWGEILQEVTKENNYVDMREEWMELNKKVEIVDSCGHWRRTQQNGKEVAYDNADNYINDKANYINKKLEEIVTPSTDYIIDLGSGWGRNTISISMYFSDIKILCGEITKAGRSVTQYFIDKYNLNAETFDFNWCEPTSLINLLEVKKPKEVVMFSFHSIEQVVNLETYNFIRILNLPIKMRWFHIEPCAWQWERHRERKIYGWNENFVDILKELRTLSRIKINEENVNGYKANLQGNGLEAIDVQWDKI